METTLALIADALFFWLKVFIPLLFLLRLFKKRFAPLNNDALVLAVNNMLLFAAVLLLLAFVLVLSKRLIATDVGAESRRNGLLSSMTGPYWFGWWLPAIVKIIMPQVLWFKKLRASVKATYTWFCCALILAFLEYAAIILTWLHRDYIAPSSWAYFMPSFVGSLGSFVLFLGLLAAVYIIVLKRKKTATIPNKIS
jgi:molybdopterin-containing oxidoreductase family membrane subunit